MKHGNPFTIKTYILQIVVELKSIIIAGRKEIQLWEKYWLLEQMVLLVVIL